MTTRARFTFFLFSLVALPMFGQQSKVVLIDDLVADNVVQAPAQLRRVPPAPDNLTAAELETKADELRVQKYYADALDYYRAAMKKADTAILENKAGIAQLQMLRYDEAKKSFERSIKLDKNYADAHNNLGVIHYQKHNYRRAVKEYTQAIKLREESASYHSNMGTALFARKDYDKAMAQYMRALELDPDVFERRSNNGVTAHMSSPEDRAKYNFTIAKMFAVKGDTDQCLLYLRKAMEEGFSSINEVYKEAEFAAVRKDPRFVALMESKPPGIN